MQVRSSPAADAAARPRVVVLVNPRAGTGIGGELSTGAQLAGFELDVVVLRASTADALARRARAEIARGVDALVVQGGDGMVHLGVGLVAGTAVPLGIVPTGSGNDFARAAGIPRRDPGRAVESIVRALRDPAAGVRRVDAMRVTVEGRTVWAANSVNIGFDSVVNRRANE
ncbi:diacylglycerol kinase family enzyme [Pseudoclavibacter chungangensis]|uniref:diacylglycerol/lipid kinase family protein n=1 Tax=Pseudoclavibacter chungangensis TaxID=587635 RepID=UPI0015CCECF1|nr:diacylglycerol kinase family protein [Pseudoclavibacter chungangensis]NYJ65235.1 diacylglycerol kinase family enzyme [Pseudoclavibacter chungangensis]